MPSATPDPYAANVTDPGCLRMRAASGRVDDDRPLVAFLYELVRDHVTTGTIEESIERCGRNTVGHQFTNGWLAQWAQDAADRLLGLADYSDAE